MMLPSFVDAFPSSMTPSSTEREYYAIDLGGTSLKVVCIRVKHSKLVDVRKEEWPIPDECYETDNGRLMAWIVDCFVSFARVGGSSRVVIGFCYSFACKQENLDHGEQILWTKRFKGTGLLGKDVVQALRDEFSKRDVDAIIPALMNDSVASLVGAQFADSRVKAAVILGTGTNCSYVEHVDKIKTLPKVYKKHGDRMIINTEWGDCSLPKDLGVSVEEDRQVDRMSANPGHGLFEKLISGLYIGDVARRILGTIAKQTGMYQGEILPEGSIDGAVLSCIYHDTSDELCGVGHALREACGVDKSTMEERRTAQAVCVMVATRSARLCAAAMVAVASRERGDSTRPVVISVDGSTFTKFSGYRQLVEEAIDEMLDESDARIELTVADGSSACGAAVCAAVFTTR
jgi:hexokinase